MGYGLLGDESLKTCEERHDALRQFGFPINPNAKYCKTLDEVEKVLTRFRKSATHSIIGLTDSS